MVVLFISRIDPAQCEPQGFGQVAQPKSPHLSAHITLGLHQKIGAIIIHDQRGQCGINLVISDLSALDILASRGNSEMSRYKTGNQADEPDISFRAQRREKVDHVAVDGN